MESIIGHIAANFTELVVNLVQGNSSSEGDCFGDVNGTSVTSSTDSNITEAIISIDSNITEAISTDSNITEAVFQILNTLSSIC